MWQHREHVESHQVLQDDSDHASSDEDVLADIIEAEANERVASLQAPDTAYQIPKELYDKSVKQNDQLTDDERRLLLSRGDVIGKALAHPASLTPEERNIVLGRPPPDQVRASIECVTNGQLHTVGGLVAKAREDMDSLSEAEIHLIGQNYSEDPGDGFFNGLRGPGSDQAHLLIQGVDERLISRSVFMRSIALHKAEQKKATAEYESRQQAERMKQLEEEKIQKTHYEIKRVFNQKVADIKKEAEKMGRSEEERKRRGYIASEWSQIKHERLNKGLEATGETEDLEERIRQGFALAFYRIKTHDERMRLQRESGGGIFSHHAENLLSKWWETLSKEERAVYLAKAGDVEDW